MYDAAVTDLSVLTLKKYLQLSLRYFNAYHYDNIFFTVTSQLTDCLETSSNLIAMSLCGRRCENTRVITRDNLFCRCQNHSGCVLMALRFRRSAHESTVALIMVSKSGVCETVLE